MDKTMIWLIVGTYSACTLSGLALAQTAAAATPAAVVAQYDKDSDQTLDLTEVKTAAGAHFDTLEKDADGTLDAKEVKLVMGAKAFKAADPDNDGTLSKDEYLALVERQFKKVDVDSDGTLSVKELRSKNAYLLKKLIQ